MAGLGDCGCGGGDNSETPLDPRVYWATQRRLRQTNGCPTCGYNPCSCPCSVGYGYGNGGGGYSPNPVGGGGGSGNAGGNPVGGSSGSGNAGGNAGGSSGSGSGGGFPSPPRLPIPQPFPPRLFPPAGPPPPRTGPIQGLGFLAPVRRGTVGDMPAGLIFYPAGGTLPPGTPAYTAWSNGSVLPYGQGGPTGAVVTGYYFPPLGATFTNAGFPQFGRFNAGFPQFGPPQYMFNAGFPGFGPANQTATSNHPVFGYGVSPSPVFGNFQGSFNPPAPTSGFPGFARNTIQGLGDVPTSGCGGCVLYPINGPLPAGTPLLTAWSDGSILPYGQSPPSAVVTGYYYSPPEPLRTLLNPARPRFFPRFGEGVFGDATSPTVTTNVTPAPSSTGTVVAVAAVAAVAGVGVAYAITRHHDKLRRRGRR